jgi:hypothetical protein
MNRRNSISERKWYSQHPIRQKGTQMEIHRIDRERERVQRNEIRKEAREVLRLSAVPLDDLEQKQLDAEREANWILACQSKRGKGRGLNVGVALEDDDARNWQGRIPSDWQPRYLRSRRQNANEVVLATKPSRIPDRVNKNLGRSRSKRRREAVLDVDKLTPAQKTRMEAHLLLRSRPSWELAMDKRIIR